jgi:hypothetical protein
VSEDKTHDISQRYDTKPTLEVILEEVRATRAEQRDFREYVEVRLDRIESMTNQTRAEMLTLRADFKEFRAHFKEPV